MNKNYRFVFPVTAVAALMMLGGCNTTLPDANETEASNAVEADRAAVEPDKPLTGIFAEARDCVARCNGLSPDDNARSLLPHDFKDAYKDAAIRGMYDDLVARLPPQFAPLARKNDNDPPEMEMDGYLVFKLASDQGLPLYIYREAGFREKIWFNAPETQRRPAGNFYVLFDPVHQKAAGIFLGEENLDKYWFVGDPRLQAILLAFLAADDTETIIARSISDDEDIARPGLPMTGRAAEIAVERLKHLNNLYSGGRIVGALAAIDIAERNRGENDRATGIDQWWVVNSEFTSCHTSGGPAEKLEQYVGFTDRPRTKDFRDANGNLQKVEVIIDRGGGVDGVTTYYKAEQQCMAEQVNYTQNLADKYR